MKRKRRKCLNLQRLWKKSRHVLCEVLLALFALGSGTLLPFVTSYSFFYVHGPNRKS